MITISCVYCIKFEYFQVPKKPNFRLDREGKPDGGGDDDDDDADEEEEEETSSKEIKQSPELEKKKVGIDSTKPGIQLFYTTNFHYYVDQLVNEVLFLVCMKLQSKFKLFL